MSKKSKEKEKDELQTAWRGRLSRCKKYQEKWCKTWKRNESLIFGGDGKAGMASATGDQNKLAYGWGLLQGLLTQIFVSDPTPMIESYAAGGREVARKLQEIVRYDLQQMRVKQLGNIAVQDVFVSGFGASIELAETNKKWVRFPAVDKDTGRVVEEVAVDVESQQFPNRRIAPKDLLIDPQARLLDLSDARYIMVAFYPTIADLQNDAKFDLPDDFDKTPESNEYIRTEKNKPDELRTDASGTSDEKDPEYRTVCVWEIYDKIGKKLYYMDNSSNKLIGEAEWPVNLKDGPRDLFPVTVMGMHPRTNTWYPKPEIDLIAPQLEEMNKLEAMMRRDSITKRRIWATIGGLFSPDQLAKINELKPANQVVTADWTKLEEMLGVGNQNVHQLDLRNLLVQLEDISMTKDLPIRKQMIEADIAHVIGYGPSQRGGVASTRSAREAMLMAQKQQEKLNRRLDAINDWSRDLIAKHVMFLQQFAFIPQHAKVVDEVSGIAEYMQYTREDLQGQFRFDVIPGSTGPKTSQMKQQSELQLFQTVAPILQAQGESVWPAFVRLAHAFDWTDVDSLHKWVKNEAKMLAALLARFKNGQANPADVINQAAKLVFAELSQPEIAQVEQLLKQQNMQTGGSQQPQQQAGDPNQGNPARDAQMSGM